MCGICGVVSLDRPQVEPAVRRMMRAMVHRGPDDEGYTELPMAGENGPVAGFGFRRLAILDLSPAGHQPMVNSETGDCIIFNGEIYNFREIRQRLLAQGVRFTSTGDTEVLLRALSAWGEAALDHLDGMFAFAFYQAATRRVLLARDHLGIKPLYVARTSAGLVFASEVQAVLASELVPSDLDEAGLATFLAYGAPQDPLTMHRCIKSLPSGSCQWVDSEVTVGRPPPPPRRYWRFPAAADVGSVGDPTDEIESLLQQAIGEQCVADVPLAVFLSGGIDSAVVAAFAKRAVGQVRTFAIGNNVSASRDESRQAYETARLLGTEHLQSIADEDWMISEWQEWLLYADRPSIDGLNTHMVCNAVKGSGNTVALSGLGGDELFGGYHTFDQVRRLRKLLAPVSWLPAIVRKALQPAAVFLPPAKRKRAANLLADPSFLGLTLGMRRVFGDEEMTFLGFDAERLGLTPHWLPPEAYEPLQDTGHDLFRAVSQADMVFFMGNMLLRDADINSMANSVEVRVPFLSRKLVDFVGSIRGDLQFPPDKPSKHLLRQAAASRVPPQVMQRPKKGFLLPLSDWISGPLKHDCEGRAKGAWDQQIVRPDAAKQLWSGLRSVGGHSVERRQLALITLGNYLQTKRTSE